MSPRCAAALLSLMHARVRVKQTIPQASARGDGGRVNAGMQQRDELARVHTALLIGELRP